MGKILCITNTYEDGDIIEGLTINKVYNLEGYFMSDFFITIDKWREQQLNKIL